MVTLKSLWPCSRFDPDCFPHYWYHHQALSISPLFPTPPPFNMSPQILRAFLARTTVSVFLNSSFPHSKISTSIAHTLNLACNFTGSGRQSCLTSLCVPTIDGYYRSQPDFVVGHNLPSDIALSDDWVCPCQPVLLEGHSMIRRPCPLLLDWSSSLHYWYPVAGMLFGLHVDIPCSHTI